MKPAANGVHEREARTRVGPVSLLLLLLAALAPVLAEASVPRMTAGDVGVLRAASLAESSRLAPLTASHDVERFALFVGDDLARERARGSRAASALTLAPEDAGDLALASRVSEESFSLHLGANAFGLKPLRGPPPLSEDLCQGDDECLAGTRIGGLELLEPFAQKAEPELTLGLLPGYEVSSSELAYGKPLDPWGLESIREWFGADADIKAGKKVRGYAKKAGYGLWNALTFGFLGRHDKAFEKYEKSGDTAAYIGDTAKEVGRAAVVGAASMATGGAAGAGAKTLVSAVARGAAGGAVSSVAGTAAGDVWDRAHGEEGATAGEYVSSAVGGAVFGGAAGAIAPVVKMRATLTEAYQRAVADVSARPNYGPAKVGRVADDIVKRWLERFGKDLPEVTTDLRRNYPGSPRGAEVDVVMDDFAKGFELKLSPKAKRSSQTQAFEDLFTDIDIEFIFGRGKKN